ncbi:hypothetical protein F6H23_004244 [Vibrio fluvialis]|nr:hypothetical protein [Vibrio fluvialis]EMA2482774.1 hypothetical protein [Vibrio fluvialis]
MKKQFLVGLVAATVSFNTWSIMGVGDIVSDPISYTYYAQEIQQGVDMLKTGQESLKTALETKDLALKTVKNLEGSLRRAQRALDEIERFKERVEKDPWTYGERVIKDPEKAGDELERLYNKVDRSANPTRSSYDEWRELFNEEADENEPKLPKNADWISIKQAMERRKNKELNDTFKRSVKADAMIDIQLEDTQALADLANAAMTQKDATDVGNGIMLKMVAQNQQIIELLSGMNRSLVYLARENNETNDGKALQRILSLKSDSAKTKLSLDGSGYKKPTNTETMSLFGGKNPFTGK